jgi:hypothetical protein
MEQQDPMGLADDGNKGMGIIISCLLLHRVYDYGRFFLSLVGNVSPDWGWETIKLAGRDGMAGCLGGQDIAH